MAKSKQRKMTIEDLAVVVKHGFDGVGKRFDGVDRRIDGVDRRIDKVEQLQKDMLDELVATHGDVRHVRSTVDALTHSDIAQETTIIDLKARVHRVEQKVGLAK